MPEVSSFSPNPDVSEYSPYGRNYGNGLLNLLAFSAFGFNYAPKPEGAQGMYDAYYQRERSRQFMNIQADAFSNNMLFKTAGFDPENNMLQFAGKAFGSPDGMVARMLSPLIGGNPMAAQMQLYAGLSGASTMGAFGRIGDVTKSETDDMMRVIEKNFYRTTPIDQVEGEMDKQFADKLIDNPELAQQLGFGVPLTETGEVDEGEVSRLKAKGAQRIQDAEQLRTLEQEVRINTQQVKRQYNPALKQNLEPKLEGVLQDLGVPEERIAELKDPVAIPQGDVDQTAPQQGRTEFNLGSVKQAIGKAEERLKSPEDYTNQVADRMAEMMDLSPFKKNILTRETTLEGGVPVRIDGKEVPAELHTQEQRDKINEARQARAANEGLITPEEYGTGIPAASPELYADITPPEENKEKRDALKKQVREGYRLLDVLGENENNRKFDPEQFQVQTQNLEERLKATGLATDQDINRNKTASGVISTEFVKAVETKSNDAAQRVETLTRNLKENENKIDTPEYDEEVSRAITDKIKQTLKKDFNVTDEELNTAVNNKGMINPEFVQRQVDRQTTNVQGALALAKDTEQAAEKKPIDREALTSSAEEISGLVSSLNENELKSATQGYDRELSKAISDKIKQKLKDAFETTEDELSGAMNQSGLVNTQFVQDKVAKQVEILQDQEAAQQREATRQAEEGEPIDFEANQAKQIEIRRILKENYNVTDEQLAKATDDQGNIKPEFIKEVYDQQIRQGGVESQGLDYDRLKEIKLSKEAPKIRAQQFDRQMQSNEITQIQSQIEELGDTDTEEANNRRKELRESLKTKLRGMGVSDEEINKNVTGGGMFEGPEVVDPEFVAKKQREFTKVNFAQIEAMRMEQYQQAGAKYSGINFEKTRGFNIEDFTSAFTAASDLRLIGGKGTPVQKMDAFMQNAGGAMSAARSVFGDNLSGGQLIGKISDLLGSKAQDLTSKSGSEEVEKMLRDVKSTARVAGTSIDALLGIIETAKEVARSNPKLRYLSAAAITDMSMKAMSTTAAMATVMSSEEYRKSGGSQQMASEKMGEQQKLLSSDVGQSLIALQQKFSGDPKKLEAFRRAMRQGGFDKDGMLPSEIPELLNLIQQQPEMEGVTTGELMFAMNDTMLREEGSKNRDFVNTTTSVMEKTGAKMFWDNFEFATETSKEDLLEKFKEAKKTNKGLSISEFISTQAGGKDPRVTNLYRELKNTINEDFYRQVDPTAFAKIDAAREEQTRLDTELDKKLGGRNAPIVTQIMSELAGGGTLDASKTERLMRIFADENVYKDKGEMERLQTGFTEAIAAAGEQDAEGVAAGLSSATGADISENDIKDIMEGGRVTGNYKSAQTEYKRLLQEGAKNEFEEKRLNAYKKMEELGLIDQDTSSTAKQKAFETFQSGEGYGAVVAATAEAEKNKKDKEIIDATREKVGDSVEQELMVRATTASDEITSPEAKAETKRLMDLYRGEDGQVDMVKMMKDAEEGAGAFDAGSEMGAEFKKGLEEEGSNINQIRETLTRANSVVEETEKKVKTGEGSEGTQQDLPKLLKSLIDGLESSKLVTAIDKLGNAVAAA